ncbi:hypothetical protein CEXT_771991 [Caerostris extrusa]|uniref:Uncharacterized protein n=1 Tax=Caerostris extrusa TaxID=172846 RepID=A0AAV4MRJ7_CAEEX|nr:hypothetical protein CEXT_771991 [Caerostris extrusa]
MTFGSLSRPGRFSLMREEGKFSGTITKSFEARRFSLMREEGKFSGDYNVGPDYEAHDEESDYDDDEDYS